MRISRNKKQFQISFDSNNQVNNSLDREDQKDIIDKFILPTSYFEFPIIRNEEFQKFKKKVIGSASQYGIRNQKTTSIFLSFLQFSRQIATIELRKKQYMNACSYYATCLGFIDPGPRDEIFLQKFIITKIDIINKFMFCIFQLNESKQSKQPKQSNQPKQIKQSKFIDKHIDKCILFLQQFLMKAGEFGFQSNLIKSDVCLIQLNYFYLARVYKKKKNFPKAINAFLKAQQIICNKRNLNVYQKNHILKDFCKNLQIKIFYKISKCYRDEQKQQQQIYEGYALNEAQQYNPYLYQYISRKIRMYKSAKKFNEMMSKLEGKKKIQQQVLRHIEGSTQKQFSSLYDVYKDRPNSQRCSDLPLKECQDL